MIFFVEIWKEKARWQSLPREERSEYLNQIGNRLQQLQAKGVEILTWGQNHQRTPHRADYDFFGIYKFPDERAVQDYHKSLEKSGWFNYFEQINLATEGTPTADIVDSMIKL
jgi:hypothetical protein